MKSTETDSQTTTDSKGLEAITGFCRQRLAKIRKDEKLRFPKPIRVGRSVRWFVGEVIDWMRAMKDGNGTIPLDLAEQPLKLHNSPASARAQRKRMRLFREAAPRPSNAEIQAANRAALSEPLRADQYRTASHVLTAEGDTKVRYRIGAAQSGGTQTVNYSGLKFTKKTLHPFGAARLANTRKAPGIAKAIELGADASPKSASKAEAPKTEVRLAELVADYRSGDSLDALCKRYRMGKSRVSRLLREAGVQMRPAGRKPAR